MNPNKNMIIIKGEIKTPDIKYCQYNYDTQKIDIEFKNGKKYSYLYTNVRWLKDPKILNHNNYTISRQGVKLFNIDSIYVFTDKYESYWHICFDDKSQRDYVQSELEIVESCLTRKQAANVLEYIKQIAKLSQLRNEDTGEKMLAKKFEKISFVGSNVALAKYLDPSLIKSKNSKKEYIPIFPFGCNNSQYMAVKNAMENQISVIQGPPGTGKTQTILNIIANILMEGKSVQVVSNNNSATENVYEKLSSSKYNLGFIVATLGSSQNKKSFVEQQNESYPNFSSWRIDQNQFNSMGNIFDKSIELKGVFDKQEKLASLKQEQLELNTELEYFNQYVGESDVNVDGLKFKKKITSRQIMLMWQDCQKISEENQRIGFIYKIKAFFKFGISNLKFYKQDIAQIITTFQAKYYQTKKDELAEEIEEIQNYLNSKDKRLTDDLCNQSMSVLKDILARKYENRTSRRVFNENDLWQDSSSVLEEYPVILSTTFSSRNSLGTETIYDYVIMDEASQVDIATGALALSCAKNVVIVGDTKQLPNVIKEDTKGKANAIFDSFNINEGYKFTKSFLQSILDVIPNVTQTLLREHYRCHPKIINFCNQKFYRGELVIMTTDKGEKDVLKVVKTVSGNHDRNHYSQRQIDVIKDEIIPKDVVNASETGIIAPYRNQVEAMQKEVSNIDVATVHKFQGKEKDTIIISTVDDEISDFADDPYLINVAVSRAKKKLVVVVSDNEQVKERNITDLVEYIQYNNFEVTNSKTYSIFDYLYKQYTNERIAYLKNYKKISEYDSENLMYALIEEVLSEEKYASLNVISHFPMNMLIRNLILLNEQECKYAMNPATHIDFLVYNRISKKPVLAVEVDGYYYHKEDTVQASRDLMKNNILKLYEIPLLRFKTNGSGEREKLNETLSNLV